MTAAQRYQELREKMESVQRELQESAKAVFSEGAKMLFDRFSNLESFGWRQYTPYFNDGDACVFGVDNYEPDINGRSGYEIDNGEPENELQVEVRRLLETFTNDDMLTMFGDHARVTVNRDGTTDVARYEHD